MLVPRFGNAKELCKCRGAVEGQCQAVRWVSSTWVSVLLAKLSLPEGKEVGYFYLLFGDAFI